MWPGKAHYMMLLSMIVAIITLHMVIVDNDVAVVHNGRLMASDLIGIKRMQVITRVVWRTFALNVFHFPVLVSEASCISS